MRKIAYAKMGQRETGTDEAEDCSSVGVDGVVRGGASERITALTAYLPQQHAPHQLPYYKYLILFNNYHGWSLTMQLRMKVPSTILVCLLLSGCNSQNWYDYGNGLVNLNNVKFISSEAAVNTEINPNDQPPNNGSEKENAIYQAHVSFCNDAYKTQNISGSIQSVVDSKEIHDSILKSITPEVLKTCWVRIKGTAFIKLDDFIIRLPDTSQDIVADAQSPESVESLRTRLDKMTAGDNLFSEWKADYDKLKSKITPYGAN
jgi:hypothetical protein